MTNKIVQTQTTEIEITTDSAKYYMGADNTGVTLMKKDKDGYGAVFTSITVDQAEELVTVIQQGLQTFKDGLQIPYVVNHKK